MARRSAPGIELLVLVWAAVGMLSAGYVPVSSFAQAPTATPTLPPGAIRLMRGYGNYDGCTDTRISAERPNSNFGDDPVLVLGMKARASILVRFDLSVIPSDATVHRAVLQLQVANYGQRPDRPIIAATFPVSRTWDERQATWLRATDEEEWGAPGCTDTSIDRSPVATDEQEIYELGWYEWDITSAVRMWVQDPASNHGVLVQQINPDVGGEYDIRASEFTDIFRRPAITIEIQEPTPTLTVTPRPTDTATPTPTVTSTTSPTPTATATVTATVVTPTATGTPTITQTPVVSPTVTATATPTRSLDTVFNVFLPKMMKGSITQCIDYGMVWNEEFDGDLSQWQTSLSGGRATVSGGVLHMTTDPSRQRFPLIWNNSLFDAVSDDYVCEIRFRYENMTVYGTTIALNTVPFDGSRREAVQPIAAGTEDVLSIHHVVSPNVNVFRFDATVLGSQVAWQERPQDTNWHIARLVVEPGGRHSLLMDGRLVWTQVSSIRPISIFIGNPTVQPWAGNWTELLVDYVRVFTCRQFGRLAR